MKKLEFKAFVDGKEVASTMEYGLDHCIAEECMGISSDLAMEVVMMYTDDSEDVNPFDF